jgi:ABC-type branched-subunit amino acid transport system substrate-binding protein
MLNEKVSERSLAITSMTTMLLASAAISIIIMTTTAENAFARNEGMLVEPVSNIWESSNWSLNQLPLFVDRPGSGTEELQKHPSSGDTVRFGALLPITGVSSSSGKSTEAALRMALSDVNANFSKRNSSLRYELVVHDTESDPAVSLEKLRLLAKEGISDKCRAESNEGFCRQK